MTGCGVGTVTLLATVNGKSSRVLLKDVVHMPSALNCLLSIRKFDDAGGSAQFKSKNVNIFGADGKIVLQGQAHNRIYRLNARAIETPAERANFAHHKRALTWDEWH
ncbi:hypothetical protein DL93DRAFT_2069451, partial [Clavulina sp. PMI_390]